VLGCASELLSAFDTSYHRQDSNRGTKGQENEIKGRERERERKVESRDLAVSGLTGKRVSSLFHGECGGSLCPGGPPRALSDSGVEGERSQESPDPTASGGTRRMRAAAVPRASPRTLSVIPSLICSSPGTAERDRETERGDAQPRYEIALAAASVLNY